MESNKGLSARDLDPNELIAEIEEYMDPILRFIDYKKIVENKTHWPLFKAVFNIAELGEKGLSKNIRWMDRINELRRIPAHATERRHYKTDDFDYIDYIHAEFMNRVGSINANSEHGGQ